HWIGWDDKHRKKLLHLVLSNDRFLIFPWVQVPNLASHALSLATQQIGDDWVRAFGYRPVLIETFVDATHFAGTCYRAANWQFLGHTQGRGRLAPDHQSHTSKKEIFLYPLQSDWRQQLTSTPRAIQIKKRYRNDRQASQTRCIEESFVSLWEKVAHIFQDVAADYDRQWRLRKRVIDTLMLMLLIFRLVCSKNTQSYGTTIDDLWDNCQKLNLALPQKKASRLPRSVRPGRSSMKRSSSAPTRKFSRPTLRMPPTTAGSAIACLPSTAPRSICPESCSLAATRLPPPTPTIRKACSVASIS